MDKNVAVVEDQEIRDVSAFQDLNDMQLALIGGGIGETIL
jgi:hypothetical protein